MFENWLSPYCLSTAKQIHWNFIFSIDFWTIYLHEVIIISVDNFSPLTSINVDNFPSIFDILTKFFRLNFQFHRWRKIQQVKIPSNVTIVSGNMLIFRSTVLKYRISIVVVFARNMCLPPMLIKFGALTSHSFHLQLRRVRKSSKQPRWLPSSSVSFAMSSTSAKFTTSSKNCHQFCQRKTLSSRWTRINWTSSRIRNCRNNAVQLHRSITWMWFFFKKTFFEDIYISVKINQSIRITPSGVKEGTFNEIARDVAVRLRLDIVRSGSKFLVSVFVFGQYYTFAFERDTIVRIID